MDKIFNYPAFGDLDHLIFIGFMLVNWFVLTLLYSFNLLTLTMSLEIVQTWIILLHAHPSVIYMYWYGVKIHLFIHLGGFELKKNVDILIYKKYTLCLQGGCITR